MRSKNVRDISLQFRNSFSGLTPLFKSIPHTVRHVCLVAAGVDKDDHGKDARKRSQIGRDNSRKNPTQNHVHCECVVVFVVTAIMLEMA